MNLLKDLIPGRYLRSYLRTNKKWRELYEAKGELADVVRDKINKLYTIVDPNAEDVNLEFADKIANKWGFLFQQYIDDPNIIKKQLREAINWMKLIGTLEGIRQSIRINNYDVSIFNMFTDDYVEFLKVKAEDIDKDRNFFLDTGLTLDEDPPNTLGSNVWLTPHFHIDINLDILQNIANLLLSGSGYNPGTIEFEEALVVREYTTKEFISTSKYILDPYIEIYYKNEDGTPGNMLIKEDGIAPKQAATYSVDFSTGFSKIIFHPNDFGLTVLIKYETYPLWFIGSVYQLIQEYINNEIKPIQAYPHYFLNCNILGNENDIPFVNIASRYQSVITTNYSPYKTNKTLFYDMLTKVNYIKLGSGNKFPDINTPTINQSSVLESPLKDGGGSDIELSIPQSQVQVGVNENTAIVNADYINAAQFFGGSDTNTDGGTVYGKNNVALKETDDDFIPVTGGLLPLALYNFDETTYGATSSFGNNGPEQTFKANFTGILQTIKLFLTGVSSPGSVLYSMELYDVSNNLLSSRGLSLLNSVPAGVYTWNFVPDDVLLLKGVTYKFRIRNSSGGVVTGWYGSTGSGAVVYSHGSHTSLSGQSFWFDAEGKNNIVNKLYVLPITNGSWESWTSPTIPDNWSDGPHTLQTDNQESTVILHGTYSGRINFSALETVPTVFIDGFVLNTVGIPVISGRSYKLTGYVKSAISGHSFLTSGISKTTISNTAYAGSNNWERIELIFTATSTGTLNFSISLPHNGGVNYDSYLDGFSLVHQDDYDGGTFFDDLVLTGAPTSKEYYIKVERDYKTIVSDKYTEGDLKFTLYDADTTNAVGTASTGGFVALDNAVHALVVSELNSSGLSGLIYAHYDQLFTQQNTTTSAVLLTYSFLLDYPGGGPYLKITPRTLTYTFNVEFYKDSVRTELVCSGTHDQIFDIFEDPKIVTEQTVILSQQNASGLFGSVVLTMYYDSVEDGDLYVEGLYILEELQDYLTVYAEVPLVNDINNKLITEMGLYDNVGNLLILATFPTWIKLSTYSALVGFQIKIV